MEKQVGIPVVLGAVTLGILGLAGAWLWRRYGPATYVRASTMFGRTRIYQVEDDDGCPVRLLEVGGVVHSGTYLDERYTELVFEYLKRYDLMFEAGHPIRRICVVGCGGYDYPEHLIANHSETFVDAVEIDPAITEIARRYFFLDRLIEEYGTEESGRLKLICADAFAYLSQTDRRYDAIVNDAFDGGTPPAQLTTAEFARTAHAHLEPGGLYLTNIVGALEGPRSSFLRSQVAVLRDAFTNVAIYPCSREALADDDNVIVIASDGPLPEGGEAKWPFVRS